MCSGSQPLVPYGVACVRELFRFLISLCNPLDKQNTETMIHMGLILLTVALEIGADSIGKYNSLLDLVRDELCRNLFSVSFEVMFMGSRVECYSRESVFRWDIRLVTVLNLG